MKVGPLVLEDIEDGPEVVGKEPVFLWPKVEGVDGVAALNKFYGDHTTASRSIHQRAAKVLIIFCESRKSNGERSHRLSLSPSFHVSLYSDSMFGDVERVVKHLRTGVQKVPKCEVEIFQVPETLTETELNVLGATPKSFYPVLDADWYTQRTERRNIMRKSTFNGDPSEHLFTLALSCLLCLCGGTWTIFTASLFFPFL